MEVNDISQITSSPGKLRLQQANTSMRVQILDVLKDHANRMVLELNIRENEESIRLLLKSYFPAENQTYMVSSLDLDNCPYDLGVIDIKDYYNYYLGESHSLEYYKIKFISSQPGIIIEGKVYSSLNFIRSIGISKDNNLIWNMFVNNYTLNISSNISLDGYYTYTEMSFDLFICYMKSLFERDNAYYAFEWSMPAFERLANVRKQIFG